MLPRPALTGGDRLAEKKLNRAELLRTVADRTGMARKEVEQVYEHSIRLIQDAVKSGRGAALSGFGNFKQRVTKAVKAGPRKDPFTGEIRNMPARPAKKMPRFQPAKMFKEYVSGTAKLAPLAAPKPAAKPAAKKSAPKKAAAKKGPAKKGPAKKKR